MRLLIGICIAMGALAAGPVLAQDVHYSSSILQPGNVGPNYSPGYPSTGAPAGYASEPAQQNAPGGMMVSDSGPAEPCASCGDLTCGTCCDRWFGSVAGLYMGRNNPNKFWTSYETNNNPNQVMNTVDAHADWSAGGDFRLGRWIDCGMLASSCCDARNGLEVDLWFLNPMDGYSHIRGDTLPAGTVSTTIDLTDPTTPSGNVEIGGQNSANFFDGATEHRIWRKDEVDDVEVNFLHERTGGNDPLQLTWLGGVRYFRFNEDVVFGSVAGGHEFGDANGSDEAYLNIQCNNDLVGPQIGVRADYQWLQRVGLFLDTDLGIFADQVSSRAHLYTGNGVEGYDIYGRSTNFSFLAQIDAGVNYQVTDHWRAFIGYRIVAVSGIALSDAQFPHYLAATDEIADPRTNGDLILSGGMAGAEFTY